MAHVLVIVQNLSVPLDRRVWLECQALRRAGFEVSVICPRGIGDSRHEVLAGVEIYRYAPPPQASGVAGYFREFVYCWVATAMLAARIFLHHRFQVLQACNPPDTYWLLAVLFKPFGVRFVYDQHDLCPELYASRFRRPSRVLRCALRLLERATYRVADGVIATNESYRDIAVQRGGWERDRVKVVRSGPDVARMRRGRRRPKLRRGRPHLACYLGIMGPQDGVDVLLECIDRYVHQLGRRDTTFALMGFGDCYQDLVRMSGSMGLNDFVVFTGRAEFPMIRDYLSTADVGLSPDPFSPLNDLSTMNKTMEYMAFELPVVAFDLKETRYSAKDAAVYLPDGDLDGFARAIAELMDDPRERRQRGRVGRRRVEDVLAWEHQEPVYVGLFEHLVGRGQRQATQVLSTEL